MTPTPIDALRSAISPQLSEGIGAILRKFCDSDEAAKARHYLHAMPDNDWNTLIDMLSDASAEAALAAADPTDWRARAEKAESELASGSFYKEDDIDALMNERDALRAKLAEAVEALRGLRRIVEEIDGAMNHGTWRDERGLRLKDTPEWVTAYNTLAKIGDSHG